MKNKVRMTLLSTAVILLVMLLIGAHSNSEPVISLKGTTAVSQDIYNSVYAPGQVEAEQSADYSTARTATVTKLYVKPGDRVTEGQPLLCLRETTMALDEEAVQTFAQAVMDGELANQNAMSSALQNIGAPEDEEYTVKATMDGAVMQAPETVGQNILPGLSYLRISDTEHLRVRADIPETYIRQVREGLRANVTSDANPDVTVAARVQRVAPYARRAVSLTGQSSAATVEALLALKETDPALRPGYSVDVKIFTDAVQDAVLVPYEAVGQEGDSEYVFTVKGDGTAHKIYVETGYELDGYIEIKSGVKAGDVVLLSPPDTLRDGDRVEVGGI
ncbi:efflux RND transporter periplasmic adaptor subunit [Intestinibacillus massiliensis]|nr:efflux RND transporter periplasmic adaptor subunit [Intestinibacillus massiliensis]